MTQTSPTPAQQAQLAQLDQQAQAERQALVTRSAPQAELDQQAQQARVKRQALIDQLGLTGQPYGQDPNRTRTTYNQAQAGDLFVEVSTANGDVTLSSQKSGVGLTFRAADFEALLAALPGLKATPAQGR